MRHQQASSVHKEYHVTSNRIAASAGTGKTYQLASRYIALLLLGAKPEEIIAITFTRKAAGEFRNRILHALAEGADNKCDTETGRNELAVRVWDALSGLSVKPTEYGPWEVVESTNRIPILPVTEAIVRYAAEQRQYPEEIYNNSSELQSFYQFKPTNAATFAGLLEDMVAVLTRLQLSTIDSFFNSLVSSNCMDLGMTSTTPLDPSEEDSVRTVAIRQYLDEQGKTDESRADFLQMFSSITEGAGNRTLARIESDLAEFLRLYRDIPAASCWGNIDSFNGNVDFRLATNEELQQHREAAISLKTLLITYGPDLQKEKKLSKNAYSQLNELANGGLRVKRDAASVIKKYSSSGPDIPDAEKDILTQIADHANTLAELAVRSKLRLTADRTRNLHKLISGYAKVYDIRMKAEGRLSFDDISRMALVLMNCDNSENQQLRQHIAYRMGGKLKHWMLDEFQDTSESQFRTLIPLLQPIAEDAGSTSINFTEEERLLQMPDCLRDKLTSTNHHVARESLFIVGDTKQSIYGFRTGKTEVFDRLASEEPWKSPLQPSPLNRSFRSSPVIMSFTNELFEALAEVERPADESSCCIDKNHVTFSYDFTSHESARDLPGYVQMDFVEPPDSSSEDTGLKNRIFDRLVEVLDELTDEDSQPKNGMSIAILVNSNDNADEILNHLRNKMPNLPTLLVKESLAAAACPMGEMLLCFFKWLLHPSDSAALNIVRASFLEKLIGNNLAKSHADWLQKLQTLGYHGLLKLLLARLQPEDASANQTIITYWVNESIAFDASGGSLSEWVLRMKNLSIQAAGASGAVQIMTMHKSKGLEFDAVILPYISVGAADALKRFKYFVSEDSKSLLLPPGGKDTWQHFGSTFTDMASLWQQQQRKEAYNLLYVAVTRAKHANYIICHGAKLLNTDKGNWLEAARSMGGLLRQACRWLPDGRHLSLGPIATNCTGFTKGTPLWYESLKKAEHASDEATHSEPLGLPVSRRRRTSPSTLSKAEDKPMLDPETSGNISNADYGELSAAEFGTLVHAAWEEIIWLDAAPLPDWMRDNAPRTPAQSVVYDALQQPEIAALFTEHAGQEVYNEQSIEAITEKNEWLSGTIDRLVITVDAQGKATAAHIIDFKTNQLNPTLEESYNTLKKEYTPQMSAYRKHVAAALGLPESSVAVSLLSCPLGITARLLPYSTAELEK